MANPTTCQNCKRTEILGPNPKCKQEPEFGLKPYKQDRKSPKVKGDSNKI